MAGPIISNIRGTLSDFLEFGNVTPRAFFTGTGDPNFFSFDPEAPAPVAGDLFLGDGALWRFDGASWSEVEGAGTSTPSFSRKVVDATLIVPSNQQMIVHGTLCVESTATLVVEGQVALEN